MAGFWNVMLWAALIVVLLYVLIMTVMKRRRKGEKVDQNSKILVALRIIGYIVFIPMLAVILIIIRFYNGV
ncbi:hypothetical protein SAMN02910447_02465 [Ruminococcus sp. YE71]|uniref:hypothetical protein n=1 Tax=unclassified Ruminococcus TaxID=2608920 RepID=UPI00088D8270|nr:MULTISPECIES: hypothetical protein [unclassified Ruminococcus]SDA24226.1 hypothetical protein SAMN02910446_02332 [Ruminococcus sp. YE78]SFW41634.1 hypothetical protein SAMN02910447_02465 [Ruminococcus sp. YE71]